MLGRLDELVLGTTSFAFETTLASKTFAPWLRTNIERGWRFHLVFLWLPTPGMATDRVADRVKRGGHFVPRETIERRYRRGLFNFFTLYAPIADAWQMLDASSHSLEVIAAGGSGAPELVLDSSKWAQAREASRDPKDET